MIPVQNPNDSRLLTVGARDPATECFMAGKRFSWASDATQLLDAVRTELGLDGSVKEVPVFVGESASFYVYAQPRASESGVVLIASPYLAFSNSKVAKRYRLTPTQARVAGLL